MVLALNAALYITALTVSLAVLTPVPKLASRRVRIARGVLVVLGGATMTAAIILSFDGMWFESAIAGSAAIVIVGVCMFVALTARAVPRSNNDDDEDDGGGGPRKRPDPPAPPEPDEDLWTDFDRARLDWEREAVAR